MKTFALLAALALAGPSAAFARDSHHHHGGDHHSGHHHSGHHHSGHHHYSGHSHFYGGYYGYRPYYGYGGYGYGYGYPYYYSSWPSLSFTYSSAPRYYGSYPAYRSYRSNTYSLEAVVQQELRRQGYYRGAIDGDIGPASRGAIRAYQADNGLSVTGRIDSQLLRSLRIRS